MKPKKRRLEYYSFYNHTGIEKHLTEMAQKGWMLEAISNLYWTYRKIEPKNIHFCVTYYPRGSDFDPEPSEDQQTFHDFCAHTGWQLACTWHQMQVFYNEKESSIPLETDPVMEVDTLHRACKKNFLPSFYSMLALGILMGGYTLARIFYDPIGLLTSSSQMLTGFAYICVLAISLVELVTYFSWYKKARRAAQDGLFVDTPSTAGFQKCIVVLLMIGMVWWLTNLLAADDPLLFWVAVAMLGYMFVVILAVNGIKQGLKKAKVSRGMNRFVTLAACFILPLIMTGLVTYGFISLNRTGAFERKPQDDMSIPLSLSDFMEINEMDYTEYDRTNETTLLQQRVVNHHASLHAMEAGNAESLRYIITTVKVPFLYKWCAEQIFWDEDESNNGIPDGHRSIYKETDASYWGADAAYRLYHEEGWWRNTYLLYYDDRIIEIHFSWEPTEDDMAIVNQKLNP
jgi:hypothetical protein